MKLLLLGATGRTGKWVLENALEKGYEVTCLARNSQRIPPHKGVKIEEGNPANKEDLARAMEGCQYIISALNISRKSDFPWSSLRTPKNYLSQVMENVVSLAHLNQIQRIVVCSAWGVSETKQDIPFWFRWMIDYSNIGVAYRDHEIQEKILISSDMNWTIVRPTGLINSKKTGEVREIVGNKQKPRLIISRQSLADYMVNCLEKDDLIGKKVVVSKG